MFTLSLLAVYRIGVFVTLPGVDRAYVEVHGQPDHWLSKSFQYV